MDGVDIWIAFKVSLIMPLCGLYAWFLTRLMQRYRIPRSAAARLRPKRRAILAADETSPSVARHPPARPERPGTTATRASTKPI